MANNSDSEMFSSSNLCEDLVAEWMADFAFVWWMTLKDGDRARVKNTYISYFKAITVNSCTEHKIYNFAIYKKNYLFFEGVPPVNG